MRIGVELSGLQCLGAAGRGIGRYTGALLSALPAADAGHQWVPLRWTDLPDQNADEILAAPGLAPSRPVGRRADVPGAPTLQEVCRGNPYGLDAVLLTHPFNDVGIEPPVRSAGGPRLLSVLYDLIPWKHPERYFERAHHSRDYLRRCTRLARFDRLLAISASARRDFLDHFPMPEGRIVDVGAAGHLNVPDDAAPAEERLRRLRLDGPFVFSLGGCDDRKGMVPLIEAFGRLPAHVRTTHKLVIACAVDDAFRAQWLRTARRAGVGGRVLVTGYLEDAVVDALYRRCAAFVFPSEYEGFGLPVLEALQRGAAVVAGDNSAQPQVVGDAGLLCRAGDPADIAAKTAAVLTDADLNRTLRRRAPAQAARFCWGRTAAKVVAALPAPAGRRTAAPAAAAGRRPRLAFFSPLPPQRTGIADYSARLLCELVRRYRIDVYHDADHTPVLPAVLAGCGLHDYRTFPRRQAAIGYDTRLYHLGNSRYHRSQLETLLRYPGVVVLHDYSLAHFRFWNSMYPARGNPAFGRLLARQYPHLAGAVGAKMADWLCAHPSVPGGCEADGLTLNRDVLAAATGVIVHSEYNVAAARRDEPGHAHKFRVVPLGADCGAACGDERRRLRRRLGLPEDAKIVGSFGHIHPDKLCTETLDAFARIAADVPEALLVYAGEEADRGALAAHAAALGNRVRLMGRLRDRDFADLVRAVDVGVSLRRPPTRGESSGINGRLFGAGVPTVVVDVGTFGALPDELAVKIAWGDGFTGRLADAMRRLLTDDGHRRRRSAATLAHARRFLDWRVVGEAYVRALDEFSAAA